MAFDPAPSQIPAAIDTIIITLKTRPATAETPEIQAAYYQVDVLDAAGARINQLSGNLVPHLTAQQINGLLSFMADLRVQAETQILP
jgi:hypothetical protein